MDHSTPRGPTALLSSSITSRLKAGSNVVRASDDRLSLIRCVDRQEAQSCDRLLHSAEFARRLQQEGLGNVLVGQPVVLEHFIASFHELEASDDILGHYLQQHRTVPRTDAIRIAISICESLAQIHNLGLVQNDITCNSIILNPFTAKIKLFLFEQSSYHASIKVTAENPLEGSSIISSAPELSGRLPFVVDKRSDLYSVGVVLHQMLIGEPPYDGQNAAEVLHGHIAGIPKIVKRSDIQLELRELVEKLLQKDPAKRYQSADSLLYDLKYLLNSQPSNDRFNFQVGRVDDLSRRRVTDSFIGTTGHLAKLEKLYRSFQRDLSSRTAVIKGISGTGKSALVDEFMKDRRLTSITKLSLKFDQAAQVTPFGGIREVVGTLVASRKLLSESDLSSYKASILRLLGEDAPFLCQLVPELASLFASEPDVLPAIDQYHIAPAALAARLCASLVRIIQAFSTKAAPLLLYLDDLQWCADVDLQVIRSLMQSQNGHVMLLLAYRTNELPHEVNKELLDQIEIHLSINLEHADTNVFVGIVQATLQGTDESRCRELADLVATRTNSNIFFFKQYLQHLLATQQFVFNYSTLLWDFDYESVVREQVPTDILDLLLAQLQYLGETTQELLLTCAILSPHVDSKSLVCSTDKSSSFDLEHELAILCEKDI